MPTLLKDILPDAATLLVLEPEQLAGYLLQHLNSLPAGEQEDLNRHNFFLGYETRHLPEEVKRALMEAWVWLEREGAFGAETGQSRRVAIHHETGQEAEGAR